MEYPRILQTKSDYEFVRKNFPKEKWEKSFTNLLDTTHDWFFVRKLSAEEATPAQSITQKIVVDAETGERSVYEWQLNPHCKLLQIGYTEDEVLSILNQE